MEGVCNVYAHSSLWMRPTGEWSINAKMVYAFMHYIYSVSDCIDYRDLAGWQNSPTRTLNSWTW